MQRKGFVLTVIEIMVVPRALSEQPVLTFAETATPSDKRTGVKVQ